MKAVRLKPDDIETIRSVRLEGLKNHPENFGADHDHEASQPLEWWLRRMGSGKSFGVWIDGDLAGLTVFARHAERKHAHQGVIGAVYVRPQYRGKGVGDALIRAALEEAAEHVEHVTLTVTESNATAFRLYERNGFKVVGRLPASIRVDGKDYDELSMHRRVSSSD
jgi:ribosomal protein S18 acetylase RimI-like enzyme